MGMTTFILVMFLCFACNGETTKEWCSFHLVPQFEGMFNRLLPLSNVSSFFWELHGAFPILVVVCLNLLWEARPLHNESLILVCFGVLELTQTLLWVRSNYIFTWNFNLQLHWYFLGFKLSFYCYLQSLFSSQGYSLRDSNLACIWDNVFTVNINN